MKEIIIIGGGLAGCEAALQIAKRKIKVKLYNTDKEYEAKGESFEQKDYTRCLKNDVKGLRIGIPKEYIGEGVNEEVRQAILEVAAAGGHNCLLIGSPRLRKNNACKTNSYNFTSYIGTCCILIIKASSPYLYFQRATSNA